MSSDGNDAGGPVRPLLADVATEDAGVTLIVQRNWPVAPVAG